MKQTSAPDRLACGTHVVYIVRARESNQFSKEVTMKRRTDRPERQAQRYFFPNNRLEETADGLHIVFQKPDIEILSLGSFSWGRAYDVVSEGDNRTVVDLFGRVESGKHGRAEFQSNQHGHFWVQEWYWTREGDQIGEIRKENPPLDLPGQAAEGSVTPETAG